MKMIMRMKLKNKRNKKKYKKKMKKMKVKAHNKNMIFLNKRNKINFFIIMKKR